MQKLIAINLLMIVLYGTSWADTPAGPPDVHVGDRWRYHTLDGFTGEPTVEFALQIVEINDKDIAVEFKTAEAHKRALRYFNHEWNIVDNGFAKFEPYYPEFKFPMGVGLAWKQAYHSLQINGQVLSTFSDAHVVALEQVTVPAGVFQAYKIENNMESRSGDSNANTSKAHIVTWYAPAVQRFVRREISVFSNGRLRNKSVDELLEYSPHAKSSDAISGSMAAPTP